MKILAVLAALFVAGAFDAFGQGYMSFGASKGFVYDYNFGNPVISSSESSVTFLWSVTGANDLLGAGIPTTGGEAAGGWANLETMVAYDGWNVATVLGGSEVDVAVNSSTIAKGGFSFNGGASFQLAGSTAGETIDLIVVGWYNEDGTINTLEQAAAASDQLGWDSEFTYATGATPESPIDVTMDSSGGAPFSLDDVPEPTTLTMAGLGGLSMLFVRRRKA